jgi:hypothetical protein
VAAAARNICVLGNRCRIEPCCQCISLIWALMRPNPPPPPPHSLFRFLSRTFPRAPLFVCSGCPSGPLCCAGTHLPAGVAEIDDIARLRQRRAFDDSLPPMTDEAAFTVRRRLMEVQETAQWEFRERQADEANEARLAALQAALEARDREAEFIMEQVWRVLSIACVVLVRLFRC